MFKEHNIETPTNFNTVIEPIDRLRAKKSNHKNGYYIVDGLWGSCFHRVMRKNDRRQFEIFGSANPKCPHTYTRIPHSLADNTFFCYVNYTTGFRVILPPAATIVGLNEAQPHKSGGWWSQSFIIYCPTGEKPVIEEVIDLDAHVKPTEISVLYKAEEKVFSLETIMKGHTVRYIAINEDGYYTPRTAETKHLLSSKPAANSIADAMPTELKQLFQA